MHFEQFNKLTNEENGSGMGDESLKIWQLALFSKINRDWEVTGRTTLKFKKILFLEKIYKCGLKALLKLLKLICERARVPDVRTVDLVVCVRKIIQMWPVFTTLLLGHSHSAHFFGMVFLISVALSQYHASETLPQEEETLGW